MSSNRTINVLAEASPLDCSTWSKKKLEAAVLALYNESNAKYGRRPYTLEDISDIYSEQAYEMGCNDMRPPSWTQWLRDSIRVDAWSKAREAAKQGVNQ